LVVDRVDRDRDRLGGARLGGVAAGAGGAAVVGVATVGDLVGEGVGAVVVGIRRVVERAAVGARHAVAASADDRVGQVGVGRLVELDHGRAQDGRRTGVFILCLHDALAIWLVVDRVDRDRDRLGGARLGGVAAGAGGAAVVGVATVGDLVGEGVGAVVVGIR